jgi:hypothetical protein
MQDQGFNGGGIWSNKNRKVNRFDPFDCAQGLLFKAGMSASLKI